jgi:hypothetical protein
MSTTNAILTLGLYAPNLSFGLSGDVSGRAAGWTPSTGTGVTFTEQALIDDGPQSSHRRTQRYTLSTGTYANAISGACPAGKLCGVGTHSLRYAIAARVSIGTGTATTGNSVSFNLWRYNLGGTVLDQIGLLSIGSNVAGWTLFSANVSKNMGTTSAAYLRYVIGVGRTGTATNQAPVTVDVAGFYAGIWAQSTGALDLGQGVSPATRPAFPTRPMGAVHIQGNGAIRRSDHGRGFQPRAGVLAWDWVPSTTMDGLTKAWAANAGQGFTTGSTSPEGGYWPLLVVPGLPSWPLAMLCDVQSDALGFEYPGDWHMDPAYFSGGFPLTEVL